MDLGCLAFEGVVMGLGVSGGEVRGEERGL